MVSRSGYTGEDGFEILAPARRSPRASGTACSPTSACAPIGLGARDSLRLEAGLPLYGHDLDETISPIEASLAFAVSKRRLQGRRLPRRRAHRAARLAGGPARVRVGLRVLEGAPAREGAEIARRRRRAASAWSPAAASRPASRAPIAMGYRPARARRAPERALKVVVRGRAQAAEVVAMPFVPHRYRRKPSKD